CGDPCLERAFPARWGVETLPPVSLAICAVSSAGRAARWSTRCSLAGWRVASFPPGERLGRARVSRRAWVPRTARPLPHLDEFQTQRPYSIEEGVQVGLLQLPGQHCGRRLHVDRQFGERLPSCWSEAADNSYLV